MVWCIVFGFCVFGVGWFAVDQHLPDLLPRVDVAVVTVVKHILSAPTSFAIESKYAEGRRLEASPGSEATGGVENQAAGNELKDGKLTMNIEECRPSEDFAAVQQVHNDKEGTDTGKIKLKTRPPPETMGAVKLAGNNEDVGLDTNPQREISDVVEQKDNSRTTGETRFTIQFRSGKSFSHPVIPSFIEDDDKSVKLVRPALKDGLYFIADAVREWEAMQSLWFEKFVDRLIPEDLRLIYGAARRALQRVEWPEWMGDVDTDKACLLLLSCLLWIGFATYCVRSGREDEKKEVDATPEYPARTTGCKSSLDALEVARHTLQAYRHEGGYIYSQASDQLRREGAAAAIIQRWFHTEWKPWLRERTLSRPSIQTTPLDSQRCIDHDDGAFVSTVLEDSCVNVDALGPPESKLHSDTKVANLCSDPKVTFQKCLMEIARRGGNHVDSSQDIRCRQKLSHSSAEISRVLLRLEAGADPCASQSQVSKPA